MTERAVAAREHGGRSRGPLISRPELDPLWYKDAIIYQLHVKTFRDSTGDGIGDFRGLTERLDYIRDLGVTAIWVQPFYPSPLRDDGYDIGNYHDVHPDYGTLADFKQFLREAHRRKLQVITELVINHTSDTHPWFQAARRAPPGSSKRNYYVWSADDRKWPETRIIFTDTESSNWTWDPVAKAYYWHRFFSHQPDLNFDNPNVLKAVIKVMRFWFDMGVDGMRLDAIPYLKERDGTINENLPETHEVLKILRAELDARYTDRFFLAEANQWPEDVREYFGDGDECHVAYHFPLMPRMYMAIAQEDRHPVIEIMRQTPDIPDNCQWAIFLRNHDELTLEMVTSRERDYMYRMYAADPRARINLGIRRRLAPLLENDGDKIRLMNSLLLTMPGSPIIYYGDELGMGDNVYLGDRNGVRTPMQWNPDRNAGFSTADPQRLYLPPVMDSVYGYQGVNVEAQLREPSSLLNWMRRMLAVRRQHLAFGRGKLSFLRAGNRKVLAYLREYGSQNILCVANLSRTAQPVELDLARYKDHVPVELMGRTAFPPIGDLPYLLTLPGYGFYWFHLSTSDQAPSWHRQWLGKDEAPVLVMTDGWKTFASADGAANRRAALAQAARIRLETELLPQFINGQRWYAAPTAGAGDGGSGTPATTGPRAHLRWQVEWPTETGPALMAAFDVEPGAHGSFDRYFVPLVLNWEDEGDPARVPGPAVLAKVRQQARVGQLIDAMADDAFCRSIVEAIANRRSIALSGGRISFEPTKAMAAVMAERPVAASGPAAVRHPPAQSTNTTAIIDDRLFLKTYRQVHAGVPIEIEIGRFLTEVAAFPHAVPVLGIVQHRADDGTLTAVAMLQTVVQNQGDGWNLTLEYLDRFLEARRPPGDTANGPDRASGDRPSVHGGFLELARVLGKRTAQLHLALATPGGGDDFDAEAITAEDLRGWVAGVRAELDQTLERLAAERDRLPAHLQPAIDATLDARAVIAAAIDAAARLPAGGHKIRHHGDYHLGQVLLSNNDFFIIDFEGEPARSLADRRRKHSPLRDVAGMIRSMEYAGHSALSSRRNKGSGDIAGDRAVIDQWKAESRETFMNAYAAVVDGSPLYGDWPTALGLLELFVLEKTLYELRYELAHRPDWVAIPLSGMVQRFAPEAAAGVIAGGS